MIQHGVATRPVIEEINTIPLYLLLVWNGPTISVSLLSVVLIVDSAASCC
jgi:hypothetical protein